MKLKRRQAKRLSSLRVALALLPLALLALVAAYHSRQCKPGGHLQSAPAQGRGTAAAAADAAGGQPVPPPLAPEDVPPDCMRVERVCVDQQMVVMMDRQYSVQYRPQVPLPQWTPEVYYNFPWSQDSNPDIWIEEPAVVPVVEFRPAGQQEPSPDLQSPVFEAATLPMLFVAKWQDNFSHILGNSAAWLHAHLHLRNASWAHRVALVVHTPLGMALPALWQTLVGPLVPAHPVQSFADFSDRSRAGGGGGGSSGGSGLTGRCFAEMLLCTGRPIDDQGLNVSQAGQFIARHYQPSLPASPVTYSGGIAASSSGPTRMLKVLFIARSPKVAVRQILNMEELLEQCRVWRYTDPATSVQFSAECGVWQAGPELLLNLAAFRSADIAIGRHGAGMANGFFMREGGAMLEVFTPGWTWQLFRGWRDQDEQPALQWWGLTVEDTFLLSPGQHEVDGHPHMYRGSQGPGKKGRDANMRVPWAGLAHVLEQYAGVQATGGMAAYQERRGRREAVVYDYGAGGEVRPGNIWGW
ncbi:hypothetical protein D9Q98_001509 [Chlorella vulgaris]|uniref:Glycosyltransferase 61 catalytic domain-containing protein n=1 Tax=Chlorella vulgaris TaxID=3077 RepID=A0A9D4U096_CHLVU|nr:hypothetical protein D9Q98_001509 [Chlorella vulgaris]